MVLIPSNLFGSPLEQASLRQEAEAYVSRAQVMMHRARQLVLTDRIDAVELLNARRNDLAAHFARYQRFKHEQIFDPVVRVGPTSSKIVARSMKVDCIELGNEFAAYSSRWQGLSVSEWASYSRDMLTTTASVQTHLEAELRAMQQLLMISNYRTG